MGTIREATRRVLSLTGRRAARRLRPSSSPRVLRVVVTTGVDQDLGNADTLRERSKPEFREGIQVHLKLHGTSRVSATSSRAWASLSFTPSSMTYSEGDRPARASPVRQAPTARAGYFVDRHQAVAQFVVGGMQRHGQRGRAGIPRRSMAGTMPEVGHATRAGRAIGVSSSIRLRADTTLSKLARARPCPSSPRC